MKKNEMTAMLIFLAAFMLPAITGFTQEKQTETTKVDVYYFHATKRCPTCEAIERETKKTLDISFADELKNSTILLHVLNIDDKGNKELVEIYEIYGSSLILAPTSGDEPVNLTNKAFLYAKDQAFAFRKELKAQLTELLDK